MLAPLQTQTSLLGVDVGNARDGMLHEHRVSRSGGQMGIDLAHTLTLIHVGKGGFVDLPAIRFPSNRSHAIVISLVLPVDDAKTERARLPVRHDAVGRKADRWRQHLPSPRAWVEAKSRCVRRWRRRETARYQVRLQRAAVHIADVIQMIAVIGEKGAR